MGWRTIHNSPHRSGRNFSPRQNQDALNVKKVLKNYLKKVYEESKENNKVGMWTHTSM